MSQAATESVNASSVASHVPVLRQAEATALVKSYVPWSVGAGLLPFPVIDTAALVAVQLRMLAKLSELYGVPFKANLGKSSVTSLLGTVFSTNIGSSLGSLVKAIPLIGPLASVTVVPGVYGAATYAIGRVFTAHFESGGTFLDFDAQKTRAFFVTEYEKAKAEAKTAIGKVT